MRDSDQTTVSLDDSAPMTLKLEVNSDINQLLPEDEELEEENFHLHLSEDEDEEKTERKNGETCPSDDVSENEVLNKFDTAEDVCLETIDLKTEDELLDDEQINAKSDCNQGVIRDNEETIEKTDLEQDKENNIDSSQEDQHERTNEEEIKNGEEILIEEKESESEDTGTLPVDESEIQNLNEEKASDTIGEHLEPNDDLEMEENHNAEVEKDKDTESGDSGTKFEDSVVDKGDIVNSEGKVEEGMEEEEEEQTNAEILKNQIMDTEDLLQIVENDMDEDVNKLESEDNEAETDKNDEEDEVEQEQDEDDSQGEKKASDDGMDIEETSLSKDAVDADIDREYQSIVDDENIKEKGKNNEKDEMDDSAPLTEEVDIDEAPIEDVDDAPSEEAASEDVDENPGDITVEENAIEPMEVDESDTKENGEEVNIDDVPVQSEEVAVTATLDKDGDIENNSLQEGVTEERISTSSKKRSLSETDADQDAAKKIKLAEDTVEKVTDTETNQLPDTETEQLEVPSSEVSPTEVVSPDMAVCIKIEDKQQNIMNTVGAYLKKNCLKRLCYEDLEEICMQKICEAICYKSEIGELRHQLGLQEQMAEMWRKEVAQLSKQARDLEIVNKRLLHEVRLKNERDKPLIPVKITRSVGLQVRSDMLPNVIASKQRRVNRSPQQAIALTNQQKQQVRSPIVNNANRTINKTPIQNRTQQNVVRPSPVQNQNQKAKAINQKNTLLSQALSNATAAATNTNSTAPTSVNQNTTTATPNSTASPATTPASSPTKPATPPVNRVVTKKPPITTKTVIDLTDEDTTTASPPPRVTPAVPNKTISKPVTSTPGVRIIAGAIKPTTVLSNNTTNTSRFMYLYNNNHQILTADGKPTNQKVMFKIGSGNGVLASMANGSTIAVNTGARTTQVSQLKLTSPTTSVTTANAIARAPATKVISSKHPAPLPAPPISQNSLPARKPIPPKPLLSIKRSGGGIVLSWKMPYNLENYENIVSYQLFAYQETTSTPSSDMWRKVGDVKALALPMACTLTQFADGNKYHFAVRAVDVHKRMGPFSSPEQILL